MTDRPNFLYIMTDQLRADWLGAAGHPVVKTPNIDALAASGLMFKNFHSTSPVCMPNRATFLTGRYPTTHGLRYNGCTLPARANTFVDVLAASGYHTAAIGKSHLQPMTAYPPLNDDTGPERLIDDAWQPDGANYEQEEPGRFESDEWYQYETPYYGYQHVDMVTGHGDQCGGHYEQWFRQQAPNWRELHDPANQLPHDYTCPQAYRTPVPEALYTTSFIRDRAIGYLASRKGEADPFFSFVSFPDPHHPFNPPGKYWDMYDPADFELDLPYEAHQNPTPPMQFVHEAWQSAAKQFSPQTATMASKRQLQEAMALSAGMLTMIDDAIGEIVAALKANGLYENTVMCFNSDHGDYLGDFNLLLKGAMPFRSITRVPMIWSDPRDRTARTSEALAATIDLPATILDRVGLAPYTGMQAESFLPVLQGDAAQHRDDLFIEYNDGGPRLGFKTPSRVKSIVTDQYRFTLYKDEPWGELYDLEADPNETHNRWDDPAYASVKADLSLRLNHMLADLMDESPRAQRRA
jgi:arylsulfatase A-like enzyme